MAISDTQKVDFLWKKLGFAATKTDTNANKLAANEAIPSPLLIRGDKIFANSASIPSTIPASSSGVVTVYPTSSPQECTADNTATANRTWKTGVTDWIPPEFGSTYLVKVYIHDSNDAGSAGVIGNQVFITGSGNDDEWFFDYQSGVLNFIGTNLPSGKSFTGKSVYISGARYTGTIGLSQAATQGLSVEEVNDSPNVSVSNVATIKVDTTNGLNVADDGSGTITLSSSVQVDDLLDLNITDGTAGQVLATDGNGNFTFTDHLPDAPIPATEVFEVTASSQTNFTLTTTPADAEAIDVYVDNVIQVPGSTENYTLSTNTLSFTDPVPQGSEVIVKHRSAHATVAQLNAGVVTNNNLNLSYTSHEYTGDGSTTDFTCQADHTVDSVLVFVEGLLVSTSDYSITAATLSFTTAPTNGHTIIFRYFPI